MFSGRSNGLIIGRSGGRARELCYLLSVGLALRRHGVNFAEPPFPIDGGAGRSVGAEMQKGRTITYRHRAISITPEEIDKSYMMTYEVFGHYS